VSSNDGRRPTLNTTFSMFDVRSSIFVWNSKESVTISALYGFALVPYTGLVIGWLHCIVLRCGRVSHRFPLKVSQISQPTTGSVLVELSVSLLEHSLPDDLSHVVVSRIVHVLHHVHESRGGIAGLFLRLVLLFGVRQLAPVFKATVLGLDLVELDDDLVGLDNVLGFLGNNVVLQAVPLEAVVFPVEVVHGHVEGVPAKDTSDLFLLVGDRSDPGQGNVQRDELVAGGSRVKGEPIDAPIRGGRRCHRERWLGHRKGCGSRGRFLWLWSWSW